MRCEGRVLVVLSTGAIAATMCPVPASADTLADDAPCPVHAVARGLQATVSQSDNLVLQDPAGPGVPVAQSCVDYSVQDSQAFASSPYPGDFLVGLPGIVAGQAPAPAPPPPAYPAYAGSRFPAQPQGSVNQPGIALQATSSATSSHAQAAHPGGAAPAASVATADTSVDPAAHTSSAFASAVLQPITVNGVLGLGQVTSTASAKLTRGGAVERASDLKIGYTTVAGTEVAITPAGLQVPGQTVGAPDTGAIRDQLAQAGVTVTYLAAQNSANGLWSAGLDITAVTKDPSSGTTTTVHYVLGRTYAGVSRVEDNTAAPPGVDLGLTNPPPDSGAVAPGDAGAPPPDAASAPVAAPTAAETPLAPAAAPPVQTGQVARAGKPVDMGLNGAYLALVFGAMALLVGGTLVRLLGVKTRWTS